MGGGPKPGTANAPIPAMVNAAMRVTMPKPQPAAPSAAPSTPPSAPPPDLLDKAMRIGPDTNATLNKLTSTIQPNVPPPPVSPALPDLMKQKAAVSQPLNQQDPKYKMGGKERFLDILGNFASGVAGKGPVKYIGPGATNRQYDIDEDAREKRLDALSSSVLDQEKLDDMNRQAFQVNQQAQERSQIGQRNAALADKYEGSIDPQSVRYDATQDKWLGKTYGGQEQEVAEPRWHQQETRQQKVDDNTPAAGARPIYAMNPASGKKELMVRSRSGKMIPYGIPSTLEQGVMAGDPTSIKLWRWAHRDRSTGGGRESDPNLNGLSAAEQRQYLDQTRAIDYEMQSIKSGMSQAQAIVGLNGAQAAGVRKQTERLYDLQRQKDEILDGIRSQRKGGARGNSGNQNHNQNQNRNDQTITRADIQRLVDQYNATNPKVKATVEGQIQKFKAKHYTIK